jgi:hypothetical protein
MKRIAVTASLFYYLAAITALIGVSIHETGDRILHNSHITAIGHAVLYCGLVPFFLGAFAEACTTQGLSRITNSVVALIAAGALYYFSFHMPPPLMLVTPTSRGTINLTGETDYAYDSAGVPTDNEPAAAPPGIASKTYDELGRLHTITHTDDSTTKFFYPGADESKPVD